METVVVFAGAADPRAVASRIARVLQRTMPRAAGDLVEHVQVLEEIGGAVVHLRPAVADFEGLIEIESSADQVAVVYGKLTEHRSAASYVLDLASSRAEGWTDALRAEDGTFTAFVADRRRRTLECMTDLIGCRAPVFHKRDKLVLMSPHAISLVASGEIPLDWDPCSVASATCVDWSVGRRPLMSGLQTLKPYESLRWQNAPATISRVMPIALDERISRFDGAELARQGDRIVDAMVHGARHYCRDGAAIRLSLTCGLDSRAVLALLQGAGAHDRLTAQTNGLPGSADVEGAARLAAMCGIPHQRNVPPPASSDNFTANVRLTAFLQSGDANAKQCLGALPRLVNAGSISGGGGEIFTGFYYPLFVPFGVVPDDPAQIAKTFMTRLRKGRWMALGAWQGPLQTQAEGRLQESLATFQALGAHGNDLADLMYLWERYGHWGAVAFRRPWSHGWTPFTTAAAVRGLFRYPRGVGKHSDVHVRAIRRYLPLSAYLMPVNGTTLLPLTRPGAVAYTLRQAQIAFGVVQKKITTKLRTRASEASVEQIHAGIFANELYDGIHALLTDRRSLAVATFGDKAVRSLLDSHRRARSQLQTLGQLVMAEHFRLLAEEAFEAAGRA